MRRNALLGIAILLVVVLLQTTIFQALSIRQAHPDFVLMILVLLAYSQGPLTGQIAGFSAGFLEDILSLSPLGFHALLRTVTGFAFGYTQNAAFIESPQLALLLVAGALVLKSLLIILLGLVFGLYNVISALFSIEFLIEVGGTLLLMPLLFLLLKRVPLFRVDS